MKRLAQRIASIVFIAVPWVGAHAQENPCATFVLDEVFCDDFSDGSITDESPVSWIPAFDTEPPYLEDGSLILTDPFAGIATIADDAENVYFTDISLRAQVRLNQSKLIGIAARLNEEVGGSYTGYLSANHAGILIGGSLVQLAETPVDVDVSQEDVMIQLDVFDNDIEFWAWPVGAPMPSTPTLVVENDEVPDGRIFLWAGPDNNLAKVPAEGAFRFVRAATRPIRDDLGGDFNGDGVLGVNDIDLLIGKIRAGEHIGTFDLNKDGLLNVGDLNFFIHDSSMLDTFIGDSNLDGKFNSGDLVDVFVAGKYVVDPDMAETATWAEGDWNGDGFFDSGDLVLAFQDEGYVTGAAPAVPEPTSMAMLLVGLIGLASVLKSRGKPV